MGGRLQGLEGGGGLQGLEGGLQGLEGGLERGVGEGVAGVGGGVAGTQKLWTSNRKAPVCVENVMSTPFSKWEEQTRLLGPQVGRRERERERERYIYIHIYSTYGSLVPRT